MSKTFTYFRKTGEIRRPIGGSFGDEWDGDEGYDFNYTPDENDFRNALVDIATNYYFNDILEKNPELKEALKSKVEQLLNENDFEDDLANFFENDLKEWFEDKAQDSEDNY